MYSGGILDYKALIFGKDYRGNQLTLYLASLPVFFNDLNISLLRPLGIFIISKILTFSLNRD